MNLKRFLSKNAFIILIGAIIGAIVGTYMAYKQTEGFQSSCNMSYCNDANFETVTTKSGQKLCLKKCNRIKANYITATSDQTICKEMSGTRVVKTVSRNTNLYSKLNINGNNSCQISVPARLQILYSGIGKCRTEHGGVVGPPSIGVDAEYCYICPIRTVKAVRNAQGVFMCG